MTIARYYVQRLRLASPPSDDTLTIRTPNPWTWARIRGATAAGVRRSPIRFVGGTDRVQLTVVVSAADRSLESSRYEIVFGDGSTSPTDAGLRPPGQRIVTAANVTLNNSEGYWKMDRDPPPPPPLNEWCFDWEFEAAVNIT